MFYYNNFDFLNKYNIFFFFLYWPKQISLLSKIPENPQYMPVFYPKYFKEILVPTSWHVLDKHVTPLWFDFLTI